LIIEDDVEFEDKFFEKLDKVWLNDFDMLFLNGTIGVHRKPELFNENWVRVLEMYGAFGYVVHGNFYDTVLHWLKNNDYPTDKVFSMMMGAYRFYKVKQPLVFHRSGLSDIQGIIPKNYKHLERGRKKEF